MNAHLHIERVEIELRGISAANAEAAARGLGPALSAALAQPDAEEAAPADLRDRIAQQIAAIVRREAAQDAELF
jgi:hypothetical protein